MKIIDQTAYSQQKSLAYKVLAVLMLIFAFYQCNGDNQTLATYQTNEEKQIKRKDLRRYTKFTNSERIAERSVESQKKIVRDIAIERLLLLAAHAKNLATSPEIQKYKKFLSLYTAGKILYDNWEEQNKETKVTLFRIRQIYLKVPLFKEAENNSKARQVLRPRELQQVNEQKYQQISKLRNDVVSGKIAFTKAVTQFSEDLESKQKQGDLGYFINGIYRQLPEIENAVERISNLGKVKSYRTISEIKVFEKSSTRSKVLAILPEHTIVYFNINNIRSNNTLMKVNFQRNRTGYVILKKLEELPVEDRISHVFKSAQGWHFIELTEKKAVTKSEYQEELYRVNYDNKPDAAAKVQTRVQSDWPLAVKKFKRQFEKNLFKKHSLQYDNLPLITTKNMKDQIIFKSADIVIQNSYFNEFIELNLLQRFQTIDDIRKKNYNHFINNLLHVLLRLKVYEIEAKARNLFATQNFKALFVFSYNKFITQVYQRQNWFQKARPTAQEIKRYYNKIKNSMPTNRIPPLKKQYSIIQRRLLAENMRNIVKEKENFLLKKVKFKLIDSNFKENFL